MTHYKFLNYFLNLFSLSKGSPKSVVHILWGYEERPEVSNWQNLQVPQLFSDSGWGWKACWSLRYQEI